MSEIQSRYSSLMGQISKMSDPRCHSCKISIEPIEVITGSSVPYWQGIIEFNHAKIITAPRLSAADVLVDIAKQMDWPYKLSKTGVEVSYGIER
jgi:hypothetical protein